MSWVKLSPQTIAQKSAIIVEHFRENVAHLLDGHAKAMVVADSPKAAVRYKLASDKFIAQKGYGYGTLVAFSGTVHDPESGPEDFTEASMNPGVHDLRTAFRVPCAESLAFTRPGNNYCCVAGARTSEED